MMFFNVMCIYFSWINNTFIVILAKIIRFEILKIPKPCEAILANKYKGGYDYGRKYECPVFLAHHADLSRTSP